MLSSLGLTKTPTPETAPRIPLCLTSPELVEILLADMELKKGSLYPVFTPSSGLQTVLVLLVDRCPRPFIALLVKVRAELVLTGSVGPSARNTGVPGLRSPTRGPP